MLKICCKYGPTCIVLLCGALVLWAFVSFAYCEGNYYGTADYDPNKNQAIFYVCFARGPMAAAGRLGIFVSRHKDVFFAAITTLATVAIAVFTYTLYMATTEQARLTTDALRLATKEYVSTNRPRLRVRLFRLGPLVNDKPITIEYVIVNVGATRARVVHHEITIALPYTETREKDAITHSEPVGWAIELAGGEAFVIEKKLTFLFLRDIALNSKPTAESICSAKFATWTTPT